MVAFDKERSLLFGGELYGHLDLGGLMLDSDNGDVLIAKLAHPGL